MRYLPDAKQMKTADSFTINELKIPSLELMERANTLEIVYIHHDSINLNKSCVTLNEMAGKGDICVTRCS